jgi:hypothetical protein
MGIDIYLRWEGMTEEEQNKQYSGFSTVNGHNGYLREAYHGDIYATRIFCPEAFDENKKCQAQIPAATLRKRLPETIKTVIRRHKETYEEVIDKNDPTCQSYKDFVELAKRKEKETGKPVTITASY